jgi:two-component system cell cycle sensor histidine kinase/response regulator CckA
MERPEVPEAAEAARSPQAALPQVEAELQRLRAELQLVQAELAQARAQQARVQLAQVQQAQMQQAQKLESLGALAGGIAHDFNNLLVGILGNASLALLDLAPDAPARQSVAEVELAAQRAAELTRQLLAYAGKGRFATEPVEASVVVRDMSALLRTAVSRNAQVRLQLADGLPLIEADVTQLRQVLMNLVTNASDALPASGGQIHVHTGEQALDTGYLAQCVPGTDAMPGRFVFLEVRDDGEGMDDATRARIFDPFFTTRFTGRGLGLAATLGIVRGHRGAIRVWSEPGRGTSMKLHFPVRADGAAAPAAAVSADGPAHGTILVVDDDASVRAVTRALLRRRGFLVEEASTGDDALAFVRAEPERFHLVLLDVTMPGLGGEATVRALRDLAPALPVVLMSGYAEQDVTRPLAGVAPAAFLPKPFRADDLEGVLGRVLAASADRTRGPATVT